MSERINETDHADIADLGRIMQTLSVATNIARRELIRRKETARVEAGQRLRVSGHAVVRYLERVSGVNIDNIRAEISDIADISARFKNIEDALWHQEKKLVLIVDDGMIVTVLSEEQSDKYIGRSLLNGERA